MRLIDADELKRVYQEVLCPHVSCADCLFLMDDRYCRFETMISEALTIDAVPVVWCKDCTKFEQNGKYYNGTPFGYCYHWYYEPGSSPNEVDGDDFCSYGERKLKGDNQCSDT